MALLKRRQRTLDLLDSTKRSNQAMQVVIGELKDVATRLEDVSERLSDTVDHLKEEEHRR